jgi:hypothetical protein
MVYHGIVLCSAALHGGHLDLERQATAAHRAVVTGEMD